MNLLIVKILIINGELGHIIKLNKIINLNGENLWKKKKSQTKISHLYRLKLKTPPNKA
ncbi:hypothetical protein SAP269_03500 [Spiroplasma ixodetis]|uniref:Uncharacterized protein n=1 Tax=Spiroplasma ixodetis TaxID=2141 RepID=A0ABM8JKJ9_9MOLU